MQLIRICENDIRMIFGVTEDKRLLLLSLSAYPTEKEEWQGVNEREFSAVEIMLTGRNVPEYRLGNILVHSSLGTSLLFEEHKIIEHADGREHLFLLRDEQPTGLCAELHYRFYNGLKTFTCHTTVHNEGTEDQGLEAVTSFALHGFERKGEQPYDDRYRLHMMYNGWQKELQYRCHTLPEMGLSSSQAIGINNGSRMISISNVGSWSTKEYLPMAILEDRERGEYLAWQIEHNGSWHWEIGEHEGALFLNVTGPTELYGHWYHELHPGEAFDSVPVSITVGRSGAEDAVRELTLYRRHIRRANRDNEEMPVIFNDYMNCLWGRPTTAEEIPLIDIAAACGCEYYCVDCGWYSAGKWWNNVGEWLPSEERFPRDEQFPEGLVSLLKYIRSKGMVPGLWLELEVMGLACPLAQDKPDEWFFVRHGKRVKEKSRYQLDFRNPEVRDFATGVIRRLVEEYGVGYIKMDYNIEAGIGTDQNADSAGDGLLEHNRAYLAWLDGIFAAWPDLVIENCGSGGMRMDYAQLKRHSVQSTSDMEDYKMYATIAVNAPFALTPEQAAVWSYPLHPGDEEETIFNMVNVVMLRIHQSGHLFRLGERCQDLIREAISYFKQTRGDRKNALPFWPLGFVDYHSAWAALGLTGEKKSYLAVWRRGESEPQKELPLPQFKGKDLKVRCAYPAAKPVDYRWNADAGVLTVTLPQEATARIFELEL